MTESRAGDEPELTDPGAKTQPAEGGRDEVDESLERTSDDGSRRPARHQGHDEPGQGADR